MTHSKTIEIHTSSAHLFWKGMMTTVSEADRSWVVVLDVHTSRDPVTFWYTTTITYCPKEHVEMRLSNERDIWGEYNQYLVAFDYRERGAPAPCAHTDVNDVGFAAYCRGCDVKMARVNFEWKVVG